MPRMDRREFLKASAGFTLAASTGALTVPGTAAVQQPLRICILSGSDEYRSDTSLARFKQHMENAYAARVTLLSGKDRGTGIAGLEALDESDVLLLFTRRITLPGDQLRRFKQFVERGRPVVGVRTASHAIQNWLEFDTAVLGGNYQGHYQAGPTTTLRHVPTNDGHTILAGVRAFTSPGSLYKNTGLADDVNVLQIGEIPGHTEPVTWCRERAGQRVFYTSLGHPADFERMEFRTMLENGLFWAANARPMKR